MWQRWKDKIKSFFTEEIEVQEYVEESPKQKEQQQQLNKQHHHKQQHQPEARMVYRYPEKKSFHFPVIPDVSKEKPKRKNQTEHNHQVKKASVTYSGRKKTGTNRKSEDTRNKVYKKDTQPFTPTEVPSPIYGFQPRKKEKEIEDVPAYQRKKEKVDKQTDLRTNKQAEREIDVPIEQQTLSSAFEPEMEKQQELNQSLLQPEEKDMAQEPTEAELAATAEVEPPTPTEKNHPQEDVTVKNDTKQQLSEDNRGKNQSKHVPFNVMMTPRDKKNLFDKNNRRTEAKQPVPTQKKAIYIPYHLLNDPVEKNNEDHIWVQQQKDLLEQTLKHFNVRAKVVNATQGPSVTRFEVQPELGVKVSKVKNLSDDLKLNMAAKDIRIEAPIPGKNTIGIEIPNLKAEMVGLQGIFEAEEFKQSKSALPIALGLSIEGKPLITNIQKMPHGLIAGATGSGKSVCINTILISLIYKASHEDVKFMLIDPKMVELAPYNGIPHLVSPVITDVKAATAALKWAVNEMEERYERFVQEGVRDIERYNQKINKHGRTNEKMPYIVIVIDELADLMMVSPQDVEDAISRIAQKARACGIHLLLATQRPSVDVITGLIKANIPTRIAFSVSSQVDSRTIIDTSGAEKLLGKGDMLFIENGAGKSIRLQGPFVSDEEIERVTNYARSMASPNYLFEQEQLLEQVTMDEEEDELLQDAIDFILEYNSASTSLLQRHFKIGYNRAARLIDTLEQRGMISGQNGSKPREVLVTYAQLNEMR